MLGFRSFALLVLPGPLGRFHELESGLFVAFFSCCLHARTSTRTQRGREREREQEQERARERDSKRERESKRERQRARERESEREREQERLFLAALMRIQARVPQASSPETAQIMRVRQQGSCSEACVDQNTTSQSEQRHASGRSCLSACLPACLPSFLYVS